MHRPGVGRLTAAHGIENSSVEDNGIVVNGDDDGVAFLEIGVFSEQLFGHLRHILAGAVARAPKIAPKTCRGLKCETGCPVDAGSKASD